MSVKNKLVVIVSTFLLCCPVLSAQTIARAYSQSPALDSLREAVFAQLNIRPGGSRRITAEIVNKALNRGQAQVCIDYPALEKIDTVLVNRYDTGGTLPADFRSLRSVWRCIGDTVYVPLTIINPDSARILISQYQEMKHDKQNPLSPMYCWTHGRKLRLWPRFIGGTTTVDTLQIEYFALGAALVNDSDSTRIAPDYINKLIFYACADVSAVRLDFEEAAYYLARYAAQPVSDRRQELKK